VDPEEGEIDEERPDDESNDASDEMSPELFLKRRKGSTLAFHVDAYHAQAFANVQNIP
jgi:hypothetical protein